MGRHCLRDSERRSCGSQALVQHVQLNTIIHNTIIQHVQLNTIIQHVHLPDMVTTQTLGRDTDLSLTVRVSPVHLCQCVEAPVVVREQCHVALQHWRSHVPRVEGLTEKLDHFRGKLHLGGAKAEKRQQKKGAY